MKHRTARGVTALTIATALLLAGCGGSDGDAAAPSASATDAAVEVPEPTTEDVEALEAVTVTGDAGTEPTLEFTSPLTVTAPTVRVLDEGTGEDMSESSLASMQSVVYNAADGTVVDSSWSEAAAPEWDLATDFSGVPALQEALVGKKVGTRILFAQTGSDGATYLYVFDSVGVRDTPTRAEGEAVAPVEGLPTVTLAEDGAPSISIPEGYTAPAELVAQPLITGTGPVVAEGQNVQVHYTGWKVADGEQFDSSWERGAPFVVNGLGSGQVIAGWDQGLVGQTVGSQVLLVIPKDLAYGASPDSELKDDDLVFVVDILRAG